MKLNHPAPSPSNNIRHKKLREDSEATVLIGTASFTFGPGMPARNINSRLEDFGHNLHCSLRLPSPLYQPEGLQVALWCFIACRGPLLSTPVGEPKGARRMGVR